MPFRLDQSWLFSKVGVASQAMRRIGIVLMVVTVAGFILSGAALLFNQDWWKGVGVVSAVASALLLIVYFHPLTVLGLVSTRSFCRS